MKEFCPMCQSDRESVTSETTGMRHCASCQYVFPERPPLLTRSGNASPKRSTKSRNFSKSRASS